MGQKGALPPYTPGKGLALCKSKKDQKTHLSTVAGIGGNLGFTENR